MNLLEQQMNVGYNGLPSSTTEEYMETPPNIHEILFPYQTEDVDRFFNEIPRGIFGSEMGTGKTEEFLALCDLLQPTRALIIVPKTMVLEWKERFKARLDIDVAVPNGIMEGKYERYSLDISHFRDFRYLVINHEMLRMERYVKVLQMVPWDLIAIDEAHRFKNHRARKPHIKRKGGKQPTGSIQVWGARQLARIPKHFYHITGTPFNNFNDELWSLLNMCYPEDYPNYWEFVHRYCITVPTPFGPKIVGNNPETLPELQEKLRGLMVRREKKDVMPWLIKLPPRDIPLQMEKSQLDVYQQMEEEFVVQLKNGADLFARSTLAQLMRLRQLALDPGTINVAAPSAKTAALVDILNDINRKVVVFSWFSSYLEYLKEILAKRSMVAITGKETTSERQRAKNEFQNGDAQIMLASIEAGGQGIDLTASSIAIFTDVFWTPTSNWQAEDRLHRIGQKEPVTIIRLVHPNTIDEDMHKVLSRKEKAFNEVMAIEEAVESMLKRWE